MKTRIWWLFLALNLAVPARAIQTDCAQWLKKSAFNDDAAERDTLFAAFEAFRLSAHRGEAANYRIVMKAIDTLDARLAAGLTEVEDALQTHRRFYYDAYGIFSRWNPLSEAARYRRVNIHPLEESRRRMTAARAALIEIRDRAQGLSETVAADGLLLEAELLFAVAERRYSSRISASVAASLVGRPGDLNADWARAKQLLSHFSQKHSSVVSARLATTLLAAGRTEDADVAELEGLFNFFHVDLNGENAAALAGMAFRKRLATYDAKPVLDTFKAFHRLTSLNASDTLPLVSYFVQSGHEPSRDEIIAIENARIRIYRHASVKSFGSALLLSVVLSSRGLPVNDAEVDKALDLHDRFYADRQVGADAAALLAAATYLTGGADATVEEALRTWRRFYAHPLITGTTAAGLAFKVILARHMVSRGLEAGALNVAGLDSAADATSIIDPTQGLITGDFINLDQNPFTAF